MFSFRTLTINNLCQFSTYCAFPALLGALCGCWCWDVGRGQLTQKPKRWYISPAEDVPAELNAGKVDSEAK